MTGSDQRVAELFREALSVDAADRVAWLAARGDLDPAIRREVEELLALHEDEGDDAPDLEGSAAALRELADETWLAPLPAGTRVGDRFELLRVLATGGMATVYEAEQNAPRRRVALKTLATHLDGGWAAQHFEHEARILAHLRHPGIAQVHACGTFAQDGRAIPWFAMEFVADARPITATRAELELEARVELFAAVCDAVHHGHQKGIVHRDLKPANILVDGDGRPKVIDFGVAKVADSDLGMATLQTLAGQIVGTLGYMSPEQTTGDGAAVDTRSDLYSLGVVLFELVTGATPYDVGGQSLVAAARTVCEVPPDRRALARLPTDLRTILTKVLQKDPDQRYASAAALGDDLRRFLGGEPIAARTPSARYLLARFARRNRLLVGTLLVLLAVLAAGSVGTLLGFLRASRAQAEAQWGRDFLVSMLFDADPWNGRGPQVTLGDALRGAAARLERDLPPPEIEADMRAILGEVLLKIGQEEDAAPHLTRAVELLREQGDETIERVRRLEIGLVICRSRLGDGVGAEALAARVLEQHRAAFEPGHPERLRAENAYAQVLASSGQPEAALEIFEAALAAAGGRADADGIVLASIHNNAGLCLRTLGRLDEAAQQLTAAVEFRAGTLGEQHPDTFMARANLAAIQVERGKLEPALHELERALLGQEQLFGPDDSRTLSAANNLALLFRRLGRLDDAVRVGRRVLDARRRTLGPDAPNTLITQANLAVAIFTGASADPEDRDAKLAEAEALLEEAIAGRERTEAAPSAERANAHASLGHLYLAVGRYPDALEQFASAARIAEKAIDEARAEPWLFRAGEAVAMGALERRAEAIPILERCVDELTARLGADDPNVVTMRGWLERFRDGR